MGAKNSSPYDLNLFLLEVFEKGPVLLLFGPTLLLLDPILLFGPFLCCAFAEDIINTRMCTGNTAARICALVYQWQSCWIFCNMLISCPIWYHFDVTLCGPSAKFFLNHPEKLGYKYVTYNKTFIELIPVHIYNTQLVVPNLFFISRRFSRVLSPARNREKNCSSYSDKKWEIHHLQNFHQ